MNAVIIIPARYNSSRFPGKPLAKIAGKSLLQRVCEIAKRVPNTKTIVATDDPRIFEHAKKINVTAKITPKECSSGTDRVIATVKQLKKKPDFIINLQGDSPLIQPSILEQILNSLKYKTLVTPVMQLSWKMLDILREAKRNVPFSGTVAIINHKNEAIWFSKQIIPSIRNELEYRKNNKLSPIYQHLGIYGYSIDMLDKISTLSKGYYEQLESLEQLRFLENDIIINIIKINNSMINVWRGVDTPQDLAFIEKILETK